jgi:hypothetical protein
MSLRGKCHCGATELEVSEAPSTLTRCNCTFCSKRGALWAYYKPEQFTLVSGRERVRYGEMNMHYHCGVCGCGAYSDTPDWTTVDGPEPTGRRIAVNARLFEDFDIEAVPVETVDGKNLW